MHITLCPSLLKGKAKIIKITIIDGKKIKNIFTNVSAKEFNLFLIIKTTAKKGANKITCSQIKHKIGKKIITKKLIKFA